MNSFIAFIKKEFYHIFRDRRTLLILFGLPIAQVLIFGFAVTMEFRNASIGVLDHAHDDLSREFIQKLTASGYFRLRENFQSIDEVRASFREGKVKMAIVLPQGFGESIMTNNSPGVQLLADGAEPNVASALVSYVELISQDFYREEAGRSPPFSMNISTRMIYNPELKSVFMFVPGVMAFILMLVSAMMTSLTIAKEKELGTMELLLASPLHPVKIILGKVTPYIALAFTNAILILIVSVLVFQVPIRGNIILLLGLCILFILTSLVLGIFISTRTNSQQTAMMISLIGLMMPTMLLSGFIFPIESMPQVLQWISHIIPARYFIVILKNIMLKGTDFFTVWKEAGILLLLTLVFMAASIKNFKNRLE